MGKNKTPAALALAASLLIILAFAAVLTVPAWREAFKTASADHPYIMGFIKFALLATVDEVLALRVKRAQNALSCFIGWRMLIWGLIGVAITFMMKTYSFGVSGPHLWRPTNARTNTLSFAMRVKKSPAFAGW